MRCIAVIPARLGSTRAPRRPLRVVGGQSVLSHCVDAAFRAGCFDEVWVASGDSEVLEHAARCGAKAVETGPARSGTHRVALAVGAQSNCLVVNVQADQVPVPGHLVAVVSALRAGHSVVTAATALEDPSDPACVKVVVDASNRALYFSRLPIPRNGPFALHIGIYGFAVDALRACAATDASGLARSEDLEQLAWLQAGMAVHVVRVKGEPLSLDTEAQISDAGEVLGAAGRRENR